MDELKMTWTDSVHVILKLLPSTPSLLFITTSNFLMYRQATLHFQSSFSVLCKEGNQLKTSEHFQPRKRTFSRIWSKIISVILAQHSAT